MWPFDYFAKRKYNRRYKAAVIVLLGAYMFEKLAPDEKARVESEVNDNFNRTDNPAVAWRRQMKWSAMAAYRAAAMDRVGIQPAIPGLSWSQLFQPWHLWRKVPEWPRKAFDSRPTLLIYDYHPFDPSIADAKRFLRSSGICIPNADPVEDRHQYDG